MQRTGRAGSAHGLSREPRIGGACRFDNHMRHKKSIPKPRLPRRRPDPARSGRADPCVEGSARGLLTINSVEVTPDYAHAKVFFSLLVGDPLACEAALNEAAGFLRNGLFKRLSIHTVPTLHFQFDRSTERAAELSALINQANATRAREDDT